MARLDMMGHEPVEGATDGANSQSLYELGLMYSVGRDVEQDLVQAHKWFNIAAMRGNAAAKQYRAELSQEMSKADIASAQRMAREWLSVN